MIRKLLSRLMLALACLQLLGIKAFAAYASYTAPTDVDSMFDGFDILIDNFSILFGVFVVVAVLVTGFFLGRRWLSKVG